MFIVRIWREPREIKDAVPEWRGVIEHVGSGERCYLKELDEIAAFMVPYLEEMGVKPATRWRVWQWLKRWKPTKMGQS